MKATLNTSLAVALLAIFYLILAEPFGFMTAKQYLCNFICLFIAVPAWVAGFWSVNSELMNKLASHFLLGK